LGRPYPSNTHIIKFAPVQDEEGVGRVKRKNDPTCGKKRRILRGDDRCEQTDEKEKVPWDPGEHCGGRDEREEPKG